MRAESLHGMPEKKSPPPTTIINTLLVITMCLLLGVYVAARNVIPKMSPQTSDHPIFSHLCVWSVRHSAFNILVLDKKRGCGRQCPPHSQLTPQEPALVPPLAWGHPHPVTG